MRGLKALALATTALAGTLGMMADTRAATLQAVTTAEVVANWTSSVEARWRSLQNTGGNEMYLEAPSITPPPNVEVGAVLQNAAVNKAFSFSYDGTTGIAAMTVEQADNTTSTATYTYSPKLPGSFDDLLFVISGRQAGLTLTLSDIMVNGNTIGGSPISDTDDTSVFHWAVLDAYSANTFSVTGKYSTSTAVTGSSQESVKFEVRAGNYVPIPAALPLLGTAVAGLGLAAWRKRRAA